MLLGSAVVPAPFTPVAAPAEEDSNRPGERAPAPFKETWSLLRQSLVHSLLHGKPDLLVSARGAFTHLL